MTTAKTTKKVKTQTQKAQKVEAKKTVTNKTAARRGAGTKRTKQTQVVAGNVKAQTKVIAGEPKSRLVAALLAIFLGTLGIHNFYLGKNGLGLTQLLLATVGGILTCGLLTGVVQIWAFIEGILILTQSGGYTKDANGVLMRD